jgi:hypothetical protein
LTAAVISVLATIKNDPEKQLVIYDLFYNDNNNNICYPSNNNDDSILFTTSKMMSSGANPENYLPSFVHRKVFEISEKFYDMLLKAAVNNTMYPRTPTGEIRIIF